MWYQKSICFVFVLALVSIINSVAFNHQAFAANSVVTDVRVSERGSKTRVVFEFTHDLNFKVFMLANPNRVVVDMPEVGWQLPPLPLPSRVGVFEMLRYGLYRPGNSRVVVDLRKAAVIKKVFIMKPVGPRGFRLVIDLTGSSQAEFLRQIKLPPIQIKSAGKGGFHSPKAPIQKFTHVLKPKIKQTLGPEVLSRSPIAKLAVKAITKIEPRFVKKQAKSTEFIDRDIQKLTSLLQPVNPKTAFRSKKDRKVVIIDSGHGGADPGTIGRSGIYEKHVTLAMARELAKQLRATGRFNVVMTRNRDIFIPLRKRVKIARDASADLFISLHADAVKNTQISGPSVYTLSERASDKEAEALAEKENKSDLIAGMDLSDESKEVANILIDLAQRESRNQSARFATQLVSDLKRRTKLLRNTHRFAGFAVLKAPDIPSVLIEMGFLSNRADERRLQTAKYRKKFSSGIVAAISSYFSNVEQAQRQ
jgi:N-acetylmuramoyl-L-alanine amidase